MTAMFNNYVYLVVPDIISEGQLLCRIFEFNRIGHWKWGSRPMPETTAQYLVLKFRAEVRRNGYVDMQKMRKRYPEFRSFI